MKELPKQRNPRTRGSVVSKRDDLSEQRRRRAPPTDPEAVESATSRQRVNRWCERLREGDPVQ